MSTTAMWLLLAVVVIVIVFASVLYKRTFTVHELALTGVMAALSPVSYTHLDVYKRQIPDFTLLVALEFSGVIIDSFYQFFDRRLVIQFGDFRTGD